LLARTDGPVTGQSRNWVIAYGIGLLAIGCAGLAWPFEDPIFAGDAIGWALSLAGATGLIAGISARNIRGHYHDAAMGGLALTLGLLILLTQLTGPLALLWVLGARFGLAGPMEIMIGIFAERECKHHTILGILDWIICVVLMIGFASLDIRLAAMIVSFGFLASGIVAISTVAGLVAIWHDNLTPPLPSAKYKPSYWSNDTRC